MKFLLTHQQTERLLFRKLEPGDFEKWLELFNDENTARMLGMEHFKTPAERCEKWFEWTFYRYENNLWRTECADFKSGPSADRTMRLVGP